MRIGGCDDQIVAEDSHVAFGKRIAAVGHEVGGKVALIFPEQVTADRIERLHLVGVIEDEQHAIVNDRGDLCRAGGQRPRPCDLEALDITLVDTIERAVAPCVVGPPPHQPVRRRRIAEHLLRHGRQ
jgi:hypothetical protein